MMETTHPEHVIMSTTWSLILLTGGQGTRLGADKSNLPIGQISTAQRIVRQVPADVPIIVVGSLPDGLPREVDITRESPPGGGPAAGVAAGLGLVRTDVVAVLATDMPFAAPVLPALVAALESDVDGVLAIDAAGREQYLCAVYRTGALRAALAGETTNMAMHAAVRGLTLRSVTLDNELMDIDTPDDLARARDLAGLLDMEEK
jgi:molybdopterin-guanine dinucleotide biosynthesis protein A